MRTGDRCWVDARQLYLSPSIWVPAVFVRWELHPMWGGEKPWGIPAPAIVRIEGSVRAPNLAPLGDSLYKVMSQNLEESSCSSP